MDSIITLTPSGLKDPAHTGDRGAPAVVRPDSISALGPYLWRFVRLSPDFTLGDLVRMVDHRGLPLIEWMLDCSIRPYLEEIEAAEDPEPRAAMKYLVIRRHPGTTPKGEPSTGWRLVSYLEAWGVWDEDETGEVMTGPIAVEHVPPAELMGIELRLDREMSLGTGDHDGVWRGTVAMRLIDILRAVFRTLDAFGSPDGRRAARQQMEAEIEEAVAPSERGEGIQADSVETLLRKLREREGWGDGD